MRFLIVKWRPCLSPSFLRLEIRKSVDRQQGRCFAVKASKNDDKPLEPLPLFIPKPPPFPQLPDITGLQPADLDISPHPNFKKPWHQLLTRIELEHRLRYDPDGRTNLFRSGTPEEVFPGSVLSIEQITSRSTPKTQIYTGLLKEVRKKGIATSIVLESIVLGSKVTMRFMIYSPMVTRISVLKRADKNGKVPGSDKELKGIETTD